MVETKGGDDLRQLIVTEGDAPELRRVLLDGLALMLNPPGLIPQPRWICVAVPGENKPRGGLIGLTTGAWFSIDLLWLPEDLRGRGFGTALLDEAERRAVVHGCLGATVGTTSASACRFYERHGYVTRLILPELRPGSTQVTLQKMFSRTKK